MKTFTRSVAAALIALTAASPARADDDAPATRTAVVELSTSTPKRGDTVLQRAYILLPPDEGHAELEVEGADRVRYDMALDVDQARGDRIPFRITVRRQVGRGDDAREMSLHTEGTATRGERITLGRLVRSQGADLTVSLTIQ